MSGEDPGRNLALHPETKQVLSRVRRRDFFRRFFEGLVSVGLIVSATVGLLWVVERVFDPSLPARSSLGGLAVAAAIASLLKVFEILSRSPSDLDLAWRVENALGGKLKARLATLVEYRQEGRSEGPSRIFLEACRDQLVGGLPAETPNLTVQLTTLKRGALGLVFLLLVVGVRIDWNFRSIYHLAVRFVAPALGVELPVPIRFRVDPGDARVMQGSRFKALLELEGEELGTPWMVRTLLDGTKEKIPMGQRGERSYRLDLGSLQSNFRYHFEVGVYRSRSFRVDVIPPPRPKQVEIAYAYPAYTGLPPRVQRGELDLVGLLGTEVEVKFRTDRPLREAKLVFEDRTGVLREQPALPNSSGDFVAHFPLEGAGRWFFRLVDQEGFRDPAPKRFRYLSEDDALPRVYVLKPGRDLEIAAGEGPKLSIEVHASDRFGLQELALEWEFLAKEKGAQASDQGAEVFPLSHAPTEWTTSIPLDLSGRLFAPGDHLEYRIRVRDQRPGDPEAGSQRSHSYRVRVPFVRDLQEELERETEARTQGLEALAEAQKDWEKRLDRALRDSSSDGELAWKEQRELESLLEEGKKLREKAQDLAAKMKESIDEAEEKGALSDEVEDKMREVQELLEKVSNRKMHERLEELQDLLRQMRVDPGKVKEMRQRYDRESHSQSLDRMLEALKKLKTKQAIERVQKELKELIEDQEKLRARTEALEDQQARAESKESKESKGPNEEDPSPETEDPQGDSSSPEDTESAEEGTKGEESYTQLKKEQASLEARAERLAEQLEKLSKEIGPESESAQSGLDSAQTALEQGDSAQKYMQDAQEAMRENEASEESSSSAQETNQEPPGAASQSQSRAERKLKQAEGALTQASQSLAQERKTINLRQVVLMVRMALGVSRGQEYLVEKSSQESSQGQEASRRLASIEDTLYRGVLRFEGRFEESLDDELEMKENFATAISDLVRNFQDAKKAFEEIRPYSGRQLATTGLVKLNRILAELLDIQQEMQDDMASAMQQQMQEHLERMSRQQELLNKRTEKLKRSPQDAERQREMSEELSKDQQQLSQEMKDLMQKQQELQQKSGGQKGHGDLGEIQKEMDEVEEALRQMQITEELQAKQRRIVTRLLDMATSLQKQGESQERESEVADSLPEVPIPDAPPDLLETKLRFFENRQREGVPTEDEEAVQRYLELLSDGIPEPDFMNEVDTGLEGLDLENLPNWVPGGGVPNPAEDP